LLVSDISFLLDLRTLGLTLFGGLVDLLGLDIGLSVLLVEFLEEKVGSLGGGVELNVLFLEDDLHGFDIFSGLSKLE